MIKALLMSIFQKELQAYAEAHAKSMIDLELKTIRELIRTRRMGAPQGSLFSIITYFIDSLEKEEQKRDRYATLLWQTVGLLPEGDRLQIQREVARFDPRPGQ